MNTYARKKQYKGSACYNDLPSNTIWMHCTHVVVSACLIECVAVGISLSHGFRPEPAAVYSMNC